MSGPKLSKAELEARRRAKLEKQREEYLQRQTRQQMDKERIAGWLQSASYLKLQEKNPAAAHQLCRALLSGLQQIPDLPAPDMSYMDSYLGKLNQAEQDCRKQLQHLEQLLSREEQRMQVSAAAEDRAKQEQSIVQMITNLRQDAPVTSVVACFAFDGDGSRLRSQLALLADQMQRQTDPKDRPLADFVKKSCQILRQYASDPAAASRKEEIRIQMETILNAWQEQLRIRREMQELYQQYCVLGGVLGFQPRNPGDFAGLSVLQKEVDSLKKQYRRKDEMDFIASQINEAMIGLGYRFVSSTAMKKKDGSEYDASLYQADDTAGISIYTDENGAVMMQMTTLGDGAVTAQDAEDSYQRQLDFCAAHPDIVQALADKGVLLKQVNYAPPSRKYVVKKKLLRQGTQNVVDRRKRRRHEQKVRHMQ